MEWIDIKSGELPKENVDDILLRICLDNDDFLCYEVSQFFHHSKDFEVGVGNSIFVSKKNNWEYYDNIGFHQEKVRISHYRVITPPVIKDEKK